MPAKVQHRPMTIAEFNLETVQILQGVDDELEVAKAEYLDAKAKASEKKQRFETLRDEFSKTIRQRKERFAEMEAGQQFMNFGSADGPVAQSRRPKRRGRLAIEHRPSDTADFTKS